MKLFRALFCFSTAFAVIQFSFSIKINSYIKEHYREFLNFGEKKFETKFNDSDVENSVIKSKVEILGQIFKERVDEIKAKNKKLDLIFLIDASSSIGELNFQNELKFVKKLLSDIIVDYNHSRVAVVTFSSSDKIVSIFKRSDELSLTVTSICEENHYKKFLRFYISQIKTVDEISYPRQENNKCLLLKTLLEKTKYSGGGTYTLGAFKIAQAVFKRSRKDSRKVLFLITDGFSNGGDPTGIASKLKENKVTIFTIGIRNGNYRELYELSTSPGEYHSYLLDSFNEFESLARRALHVACPAGSFGNGPNLCLPCPDVNHIAEIGSESCKCKLGYQSTKDNRCEVIKCSKLSPPEHGYFVKSNACAYVFNSACGVRCQIGYTLEGSSIRLCQSNATWSGQIPSCQIKSCEALTPPSHGTMTCQHSDLDETYTNEPEFPVDTVCSFACERGRTLVGSRQRTCLPLAHWDGLKTSCKQVKCNKLPKLQHGHIEPKSCTYGKQNFGKTCSYSCEKGFEIIGPTEKHYITKPKLTCPENIKNSTLPGKNYGQAVWTLPKATDNEKPTIEDCEDPPSYLSTEKSGTDVVWDEPNIYDNSQNVHVVKTHEFGFFKTGTTQVTYTAVDLSNNVNTCTLNITIEESVCEPLPDPIYGKSECRDSEDGLKCVITCLEGYAVPITGATETIDVDNDSIQFICNKDNPLWYSYENQIFPECSVTELPVEVSENVTIDLESEDMLEICKNETRLMQLNNKAKEDIATTLYEVCNDVECHLHTQAACEDYRSVLEELSNLVKRQATRAHTSKRQKKIKKQRKKKNKKIKLNVQVDAKTVQEDKRKKLLLIKHNISSIQTIAGNNVTRIDFKESKIKCLPGNVRKKLKCVHFFIIYTSIRFSQTLPGSHCETKLDSCLYSPCKNGGICIPNSDGGDFSCKCRRGFTGETCEIVEDGCSLNCLNNGTCMQDDNGSSAYVENLLFTDNIFRCTCEDGYTGPDCKQKIDPCSKNECKNNATCKVSEKSYICECKPNFYGKFCETKSDKRFVLVFTRSGVTDSVKLEEFDFNLFHVSNSHKISICLWIQTLDTQNYGTILSYATFKYDNTFTITDYGGLVFYINNKKIYSDIMLNDGFWHHFCFTWRSNDGEYLIYVDGKVIQQGQNFSRGEFIQGNGKMIIGQEQDIMGGKFSQSEAFLGKISHFDVWDKVLSAKDIFDQMNSCEEERFGNVYAWPDMNKYVFGKVRIENSPFCLECNKSLANSIRNGYIEIINNTAYYKCDKGYILSENKYYNGRRCNKAGEWEGHEEPYCKSG
ncbi:complement component-related sushi domain-containing [Holotrichia oblita]|uniref:Complement component-related sushi domain-containing n=1 Tax=Holotrichia oblita TaxID=644536 RepID=A0ACB9T892_HOLOL|nr:complement component-related sushi domain-containing [Holotrichia oblita]